MVAKKDKYAWEDGAEIDEHTKTKHNILREYVREYISIRFQSPLVRKLKFSVVDGFCGGGRYKDKEPGSPLIFLEEIKLAFLREKERRRVNKMPEIHLEVVIFFNDSSEEAINSLKKEIIEDEYTKFDNNLNVSIKCNCGFFSEFYPFVRQFFLEHRFKNILFNLDQCGNTNVDIQIIKDIIQTFEKAEVILTFLIEPFVKFLSKHDPERLAKQLRVLDISVIQMKRLDWLQDGSYISRQDRMGAVECIVYDQFKSCAKYVSPFSIHNPEGWKYWSIHFTNNLRAREAYNCILHKNASYQAHYGPSGLKMLCSNFSGDSSCYLFKDTDRDNIRRVLYDDVPRVFNKFRDGLTVNNYLENSYRSSVAHRDDLLKTALSHPDVKILTQKGNMRRSIKGITGNDILYISSQISFYL